MYFENLPSEPAILLSFVNTRLRDRYGSLQELCDDMQVDEQELCDQLAEAGFVYDRELNKFV